MRPTAIRRLLVFGVCLVAVACLYLVPSMAGAPGHTGSAGTSSDLPTTATPGGTLVTAISAQPTAVGETSVGARVGDTQGTARTTTTERSSGSGDPQRRSSTERTAATAVAPGRGAGAPPEVGRLTLVSADQKHLVVSWPEVDDDHLVGYEVWLNGFFVVTVPQARARLAWFNDSDTHVIQVRALDDAGQEGPVSPTLLVTRPAPPPEPTPPAASTSTTAPPTKPSNAPPADREDAEAPLDQTSTAAVPISAETGGQEDRS